MTGAESMFSPVAYLCSAEIPGSEEPSSRQRVQRLSPSIRSGSTTTAIRSPAFSRTSIMMKSAEHRLRAHEHAGRQVMPGSRRWSQRRATWRVGYTGTQCAVRPSAVIVG